MGARLAVAALITGLDNRTNQARERGLPMGLV